MSEQTMMDDVTRANRAKEFLASAVYQDAIAALKADAQAAFLACPIRDTEGLQLILQHSKLVQKLDDTIRGYVESGKLATLNLDAARSENAIQKMARKFRTI